jgi:hypothetical protein
MVLPGLASALTIEVTTIEDKDESEFEPCFNVSSFCSFREAIIQANDTAGEDKIFFGGIIAGAELEVDLIDLGSLPPIEEAVEIDGGTAVGAGGEVGVALTPGAAEGSSHGLEISGASDVVIEGLAIGGFNPGVEIVEGSEDVTLCNDYIGTELDGVTTRDNVNGVLVGASVENVNVGGLGCADNVISGNEEYGLVIEGIGTEVTGNLIGTDANGGPLGNGAGGIKVGALAIDTEIRDRFDEEVEIESSNLIAHNGGPGVTIASGESLTGVFGNSIFDNNGLGIAILADDEVPAPVLTGLATAAGSTTVSGTLSGAAPNATYAFDFYANTSCDPSGFGEGETYLGASPSQQADAGGNLSFSTADLDQLPAGQSVITATATEVIPESFEQVSEFSQCFSLPAPPGPPAPNPPAPPTPGLQPVNGELLVAGTQSGTIKVKVPGQNKFKTLAADEEIPVGSIVDATNGKVTLTSVNKAGETQTAVFYGGKFLIAQKEGAGLVVLKLRGGNFSSCKGASGSAATASGKSGRKLWGSGKGKFRTEGSYGSATVRGTVWLTEDRCNGTFFKTKKGVVSIRDFVTGTNFSLAAGKSYLAKKEG